MSIVGRTYLERGRPVVVLAQWHFTGGVRSERVTKNQAVEVMAECNSPYLSYLEGHRRQSGSGPRNVLIRREDGELVVRPFRGLRKAPADNESKDADLG